MYNTKLALLDLFSGNNWINIVPTACEIMKSTGIAFIAHEIIESTCIDSTWNNWINRYIIYSPWNYWTELGTIPKALETAESAGKVFIAHEITEVAGIFI